MQNDELETLEKRVANLEPRLDKLETEVANDIKNILGLLKKIEVRVAGGGIYNPEDIGLIAEVREIKSDLIVRDVQLKEIQNSVHDIKNNFPLVVQLTSDVEKLKEKITEFNKYKLMIWGGIITLGWLLLNYGGIAELLKKLIK